MHSPSLKKEQLDSSLALLPDYSFINNPDEQKQIFLSIPKHSSKTELADVLLTKKNPSFHKRLQFSALSRRFQFPIDYTCIWTILKHIQGTSNAWVIFYFVGLVCPPSRMLPWATVTVVGKLLNILFHLKTCFFI